MSFDVTYQSTFLVLLGEGDSVKIQFPRRTPISKVLEMAKVFRLAVAMAQYNLTYRVFTGGEDSAIALVDDAGKVHHVFSPDESYINMRMEARHKGLSLREIQVSIECNFVKLVYMKEGDRYYKDFRVIS